MVSDETVWKSLIFAVCRLLYTSCLTSLMSKCDLTVKSANLKLAKEFGSVLRKLTAIEIETSMTRQIGCNIALAVILKVGPALSKFYHLQAFQCEHGDVETSGVRLHDSNTALFRDDSSLWEGGRTAAWPVPTGLGHQLRGFDPREHRMWLRMASSSVGDEVLKFTWK